MKKKAEEIESGKKVKVEREEEESSFDFMGLLKNPAVASLMESGMGLFKKEKSDPDVCEISIKAPSEVVLKLFRVNE